ncbi:MAG: nucleotidyltransferase domain-containing protein [Paracoccaceae bacterium]|nr:nucleotidyltransferase domain-containing protein [Paracoccaceae bacterium]
MTLPAFEALIDKDVRSAISEKLDAIEADWNVRILFAVESGSRAWGFPSPDSDYDVRFVYAHERDWYLSLTPGRDVIELPISDDLDINGWDLRKALNLLLKPNPVLLEWLSSPVRYRWSEAECRTLEALAVQVAHHFACRHHYLHLGQGQWQRHIAGREAVNYKKYFYVLRPALALRWSRSRPEPPPMNLQALVAGLRLEPPLVAEVARLLEAKAAAKETGDGPRISAIDDLIERELDIARNEQPQSAPGAHREAADQVFRDIVERRI